LESYFPLHPAKTSSNNNTPADPPPARLRIGPKECLFSLGLTFRCSPWIPIISLGPLAPALQGPGSQASAPPALGSLEPELQALESQALVLEPQQRELRVLAPPALGSLEPELQVLESQALVPSAHWASRA
jgi:hypothetical protein